MTESSSCSSVGPVVCYVTDRKALAACAMPSKLSDKIRAAAAARADWIQIREKDLPTAELFTLAREATQTTGKISARPLIIVNDRLDVALAAQAAGVHLGRESISVRDTVRWCRAGNAPDKFLIGVSCHGIDEAQEAENSGANYVFFGPVFDTPSKRSYGSPQGIAQLAQVCRSVRIPVIAIGGVNEENSVECLKAGARGIAAIRLFQEPVDLTALRNSIARLHGGETLPLESSR